MVLKKKIVRITSLTIVVRIIVKKKKTHLKERGINYTIHSLKGINVNDEYNFIYNYRYKFYNCVPHDVEHMIIVNSNIYHNNIGDSYYTDCNNNNNKNENNNNNKNENNNNNSDDNISKNDSY